MCRVAFVLCLLFGCGLAWGQPTAYESFEDGVPAYFTATRAGSLSISPWHSKQGKKFAALGVVRGRGSGHPPRHRGCVARRRLSLQGLLRRVGVRGEADRRCAGLRVPRGREGHRLVPRFRWSSPAGGRPASSMTSSPTASRRRRWTTSAFPRRATWRRASCSWIPSSTTRSPTIPPRSSRRRRPSGGAPSRTSGVSPSPSA